MSIKGLPGAKGDLGDKGLRGEKGLRGASGENGLDDDESEGPQGPRGDKGDKGLPGVKGGKGPMGKKGESSIDGEKGARGDEGDAALPTDRTGRVGLKGVNGDKGELGPRGQRGDEGEVGVDGPKGDKGETGPQGDPGLKGDLHRETCPPGEKGDKGAALGDALTVYARHFQRAELQAGEGGAACPYDHSLLWFGYSLLQTDDESHAHVQDLGRPGSCVTRFDPMPFMTCNGDGVCLHSLRHADSNWLSAFIIPDEKFKDMLCRDEVQRYISRCVVCVAKGPVIAFHSQSTTTPKCPTVGKWRPLWNGFSFLMVHSLVFIISHFKIFIFSLNSTPTVRSVVASSWNRLDRACPNTATTLTSSAMPMATAAFSAPRPGNKCYIVY